jgi:hypothetical protein
MPGEPVPPRPTNWAALNRALDLAQKALATPGTIGDREQVLREIEIALWEAKGYSPSEIRPRES